MHITCPSVIQSVGLPDSAGSCFSSRKHARRIVLSLVLSFDGGCHVVTYVRVSRRILLSVCHAGLRTSEARPLGGQLSLPSRQYIAMEIQVLARGWLRRVLPLGSPPLFAKIVTRVYGTHAYCCFPPLFFPFFRFCQVSSVSGLHTAPGANVQGPEGKGGR